MKSPRLTVETSADSIKTLRQRAYCSQCSEWVSRWVHWHHDCDYDDTYICESCIMQAAKLLTEKSMETAIEQAKPFVVAGLGKDWDKVSQVAAAEWLKRWDKK